MNALPHIGQTVRNRRDLRVLRGAEAYAEHQRYTDPSLDWEMERAARTELLPTQPEPVLFCAPVEEYDDAPLPIFLAFAIGAMGIFAAIGYATWWAAPYVADLIAWLAEKLA